MLCLQYDDGIVITGSSDSTIRYGMGVLSGVVLGGVVLGGGWDSLDYR